MRTPIAFFKESGGAPPPAWVPTDFSGGATEWWMRADLGVTVNGSNRITSMLDQSGAGDSNRDQITGPDGEANMPTLVTSALFGGKSHVAGSGSGYLSSVASWAGAFPLSPPYSILAVARFDTDIAGIFGDGDNNNNMVWLHLGSGGIKWYTSGVSLNSGLDTLSEFALLITDDGTAAADANKLYVNDFSTPLAASVTKPSNPLQQIDLMRGVSGVANAGGQVAEVSIWSGVPAGTDINDLRTYLDTTRAYGIVIL